MAVYSYNMVAYGTTQAIFRVTATEGDYDVETNTSPLTVKLELINNNNTPSYNSSCSIYLNVNGKRVYTGSSFDIRKGDQKFYEGTTTIEHKSDGKATVPIYAYFASGVSLGTAKIDESFTCVTIPRKTILSLSADELYFGEKITVTCPKKASAFENRLFYKIEGQDWVALNSKKDVGDSYVFDVSFSIMKSIPNDTECIIQVACDTYSGETCIGSSSDTFTAYVPDSIVPYISTVKYEEAADIVADNFEGVVQNLSQLLVSITAKGTYGSTITSYKTKLDGITYAGSEFTSQVLKTSGVMYLTTTVTDSRGRVSKDFKTKLTVIEYMAPYIQIDLEVEKNSVLVKLQGSVSSVNEQNTRQLKLKYKSMTDESYTEELVEVNDWDFDIVTTKYMDTTETTYEFIAELTDKLDKREALMQTGRVTISRRAGGRGVTFGGEAEMDGLVSKWNTFFEKNVNITGRLDVHPIGAIVITSTPDNPSSKFGGNWECIDKNLEWRIWDSNVDDFWIPDATHTKSSTVYAAVEGHMVTFRFDIVTNVSVVDDDIVFGTIDYKKMGFTSTPYSAIYAVGVSDGGNANACFRLDYLTGELRSTDINPKTDAAVVPAGATLYVLITLPISNAAMINEFCNKFYWKRNIANVDYDQNTGELIIEGYTMFYNENTGELTIEGANVEFNDGELTI